MDREHQPDAALNNDPKNPFFPQFSKEFTN